MAPSTGVTHTLRGKRPWPMPLSNQISMKGARQTRGFGGSLPSNHGFWRVWHGHNMLCWPEKVTDTTAGMGGCVGLKIGKVEQPGSSTPWPSTRISGGKFFKKEFAVQSFPKDDV